ncbi:MAG: SDR family oxidoreductase [Betaproteobacteria bacterium]
MPKAIVTGHTRGLGAAIAEALLARGWAVLGLARTAHPDLGARYPGTFSQVSIDLADSEALAAWLGQHPLERFFADADAGALVNNAGLLEPIGPLGDQGSAAIARAVTANVAAPLILGDAFVAATRPLADRRILHVSSGAGRSAYPGWSVYCATKAALDHHARAVALEQIAGLRIVSLAPGVIDTGMQDQIRAVAAERFPLRERFVALKRDGLLVEPADAARRLVMHLLDAAYGSVTIADLRELPAG